MTFLRYFLYILGAAILASIVGGVFIGAGVMGFCLVLVTLVHISRNFARKKDDANAA